MRYLRSSARLITLRSLLPFLEPTAVVGQFPMQTLAFEPIESGQFSNSPTPIGLGTSLMLNLDEFPELKWLSTYLTYLQSLQSECVLLRRYRKGRLTHAIQSIAEEGEVYRDYWIEPYTKTKKGKDYTYYQLRWLTGERKKSGQPKVKTKHLSHRAVPEVQAARASRYPQGVARGNQVEALKKERRQVEVEIERIKYMVRGTGRRLQRIVSQNLNVWEGNHDDQ
ncbi:MAG: hypothetical protein NW224_29280 [Leptolyngbyaceae cyanobacterium bins.302]|nr:hypothetical protein [Leptolyngbyaceae cyanobacterium bins.302]